MNLDRCKRNVYTMLTSTRLFLSNNFVVKRHRTAKQTRDSVLFVQNYKSISLQSARMEEKLWLEQWKCTSTCKFEEIVAKNCASLSRCFEFSKLADPRNSSSKFLTARTLIIHFSRTISGFQESIGIAKSKKYMIVNTPSENQGKRNGKIIS